jgi:hypothetical protein
MRAFVCCCDPSQKEGLPLGKHDEAIEKEIYEIVFPSEGLQEDQDTHGQAWSSWMRLS